MSEHTANDSLLEMFLYETSQNTEQLEQIILKAEETGRFTEDAVNEIFRIMHTIKGSSAMMSFDALSAMAHRIEDLFFFVRENPGVAYSFSEISDLVLSCMDCINQGLADIRDGHEIRADVCSRLVQRIENTLDSMRSGAQPVTAAAISVPQAMPAAAERVKADTAGGGQRYRALLYFESGCSMENIRAYAAVRALTEIGCAVTGEPADILENDDTAGYIRAHGFVAHISTDLDIDTVRSVLMQTAFLRDLELAPAAQSLAPAAAAAQPVQAAHGVPAARTADAAPAEDYRHQTQSIISVSVSKLDRLMDLMGETVIAEAMVTENTELVDMEIPGFRKASAHLRKIIMEMQDMVMSLRLVPLAATFQKMHRIVRDMSRKLGKNVRLVLSGEDTDVDKNIIEHISDPLIHLVRNGIDHGVESEEERVRAGKAAQGTIRLEAQNAGGDVIITIADDGRGLDREKILAKARRNRILKRPESEMSDREIYNLIFLPGFSTNEQVTEYSGRGVGMDVVTQNINAIGGTVSVDSTPGMGMTTTLKIPLTIAIIDGMNIAVGGTRFTVPITAIRESFRPAPGDIFRDLDGNEVIMVRGECLSVLYLHRIWGIETEITDPCNGILILIEQDEKKRCIFVDGLIGRQQVVVKSLPRYLKRGGKLSYLSGCTLLGDGSISLILDAAWLVGADI